MKPPIATLTSAERELVNADIFYMNMAELREFCDARGIPYVIRIETAGGIRQTRDADRKGIVIDRILHFLHTGEIKPATIFPLSVTSTQKLVRAPLESDLVLYGHYRNHDPATLDLMKGLTKRRFEFGAIAQEVLRACWSRGHAPTYREFAELWQSAADAHSTPNPEWAFLSDLARGTAGADWKQRRNQKAAEVVALLRKLPV